jgi:hypothetical protein
MTDLHAALKRVLSLAEEPDSDMARYRFEEWQKKMFEAVEALEVASGDLVLKADVDGLVEALSKPTSGGERKTFSRVGHHLLESSWHVHLAGFRSADDAIAALAALAAWENRNG